MRKFLIGLRTSIKISALFAVSLVIIFAIVMGVYKPIYSVTIDGEMVGYSKDRAALQARINDYIEKENKEGIAFIQIDQKNLPEYKLCFLKRGIETNDDEIYEKVVATGTAFYRYYALIVGNEEKCYVETFEEAENIVNGLKDKNSNNLDSISIKEKYVTNRVETTDKDTAVAALFEEKKVNVEVAQKSKSTTSSGGKISSGKVGSGYKSAGINFIKPISAVITSRFGSRWGKSHKGLDFGASTGTTIKAAAAGTVTFAGWNSGGYGNLVIISHGNGVQTYYAHCSSITTKVGARVSSGQAIAKVGNTGRSYGSHLHFEIRINDVAYNPELYL